MNRRDGFTLLEVIVSLSIAGIVGIFLAGFLKTGLDLYQKSHDSTYGKYLCQKAWEYLEQELRFASRFAEAEKNGELCLVWYERDWDNNSWSDNGPAELQAGVVAPRLDEPDGLSRSPHATGQIRLRQPRLHAGRLHAQVLLAFQTAPSLAPIYARYIFHLQSIYCI